MVVSFNVEYGPSLFDNGPKERISLTMNTHKTSVYAAAATNILDISIGRLKISIFSIQREGDMVCPVPLFLSFFLSLECKEILKYAWVALIVHYLEDVGIKLNRPPNKSPTHSFSTHTHRHTQTHTDTQQAQTIVVQWFWLMVAMTFLK